MDSHKGTSKPFMTPTQQREYLAQLRRQNEELYKLTGARSRVNLTSITGTVEAPSGSAGTNLSTSPAGPPKPPKPSKTPSNRVESVVQGEENLRLNGFNPPRSSVQKPKPLPKPSRQSESRPTLSAEPMGHKKSLPPIPTKPQSIRSNSTRLTSPSNGECLIEAADAGNQFSVSSTNVTRSSNLYGDLDSERRSSPYQKNDSRKVTIPIFSFPDAKGYIQRDKTETFPNDVQETERLLDGHPISLQGENSASSGLRNRPRLPLEIQQLVDSGLHCANCYEALGSGRVISANSRRYHPSHFTCFECNTPLEHVEFYVHKPDSSAAIEADVPGEIYCHFDYHELFSPRCHYCTTPVIRDGIKALNSIFHSEHFFCALCSETFCTLADGTTEFVEKNGLAWHPGCYEEKFSASYTCRKCRLKIGAGQKVVRMGQGSHFHSECFRCAHCKAPLEEELYWSKTSDGICKDCKHKEVKLDL